MTPLPDYLASLHLTIISEDDESIIVQKYGGTFKISKRAIDEYESIKTKLHIDGETGIYTESFYEKAVELQQRFGPAATRLFRGGSNSDNRDELVLGDRGAQHIKLQGSPSELFIFYFLEHTPKFRRNFRPAFSRAMYERMKEATINKLFRGTYTISIHGVDALNPARALESFHLLQDSALFNITYVTDVAVVERRVWDRDIYKPPARATAKLSFPMRVYRRELVSYYELASSSDNRLLQYLAYYQILEYFFVSASEENLERRLGDTLVTPGFSHAQTSDLRKLIKAVRRFDRDTKEERMLRTVLERYFSPPDEIIDFVQDYEREEGPHFTAESGTLGFTHRLNLHPNEIMQSLAHRIYKTRNVLVHNKEDDLPRFVPFSAQDEHLHKEVSLVRFLAEQLIIKTGDDV
jgi:hypothetical protein